MVLSVNHAVGAISDCYLISELVSGLCCACACVCAIVCGVCVLACVCEREVGVFIVVIITRELFALILFHFGK